MAIRNLLHTNHIHKLRNWLNDKGWTEYPPVGTWEYARFKKDKEYLILYYYYTKSQHPNTFPKKINSHLTVQGKDVKLIKSFLKTL